MQEFLEYEMRVESQKVIAAPWTRLGSGFTLLFETYAMLPIESEMSVSKVGSLLKVHPIVYEAFSSIG